MVDFRTLSIGQPLYFMGHDMQAALQRLLPHFSSPDLQLISVNYVDVSVDDKNIKSFLSFAERLLCTIKGKEVDLSSIQISRKPLANVSLRPKQ
jgi:hypothetical protein